MAVTINSAKNIKLTSPNCPSPSISTNLRFLRGNSAAATSAGDDQGSVPDDDTVDGLEVVIPAIMTDKSVVAYGLALLTELVGIRGSDADDRELAKSFEFFSDVGAAGFR